MAKGILIVHTAAADGRDDEFLQWYGDVHIPEILQLSGFTAARRFTRVGESAHPYLAVYELEADDITAAQAAIGAAAQAGQLQMSDAMSMDPPPKMELFALLDEHQA